jgi:hypothetical protein
MRVPQETAVSADDAQWAGRTMAGMERVSVGVWKG